MLKLAGETDIGLEKIETIHYAPNLQNSGDLEAGTHTIVPTSRPAIGSAQYSKALTLAKPDDARLEVQRIAARLNVNIAGLGTATHVYCSVRVDVDDADHELFNEDWISTGSKLDAVDTRSGNKSTIFSLLKDGSAHTFYFLFWADVASQATINLVQLWEGVGSCATGWASCLHITHRAFLQGYFYKGKVGTGSPMQRLCFTGAAYWYLNDATEMCGLALVDNPDYNLLGTVATDLNYLQRVALTLRSEQ